MSESGITWGRRLAWAGSVVALLTAAIKTVGTLTDSARTGLEEQDRLLELMEKTPFQMFGVTRTMAQILAGFGWYFVLFAMAMGLVPILVLTCRDAGAPVLRRVVAANGLFAGLTAVVSVLMMVPPPAVLLGIVTVCFGASAACLGGARRIA